MGKFKAGTSFDDIVSDLKREGVMIVHKGIPKYDRSRIIPFSSPRLNYMLYGGFLSGKMYEFCGEEGSGKTTTALDLVKNAQLKFKNEAKKGEKPKRIFWLDAENTLDLNWAEKIGVDVDALEVGVLEQQYAELAFESVLNIIRTGEVGLVVIDSLAALLPLSVEDKRVEDKVYAGISQAVTRYTTELIPLLNKTGCTVLHVNQLRTNFNNIFDNAHTPGGKALAFFNSGKIKFSKGDFYDEKYAGLPKSAPTGFGMNVEIQIVKIKGSRWDRKRGFYSLTYDLGIDVIKDLIETGLQLDFMTKSGASYQFVDKNGAIIEDENGKEIKLVGIKKVYEYLEKETTICNEMYQRIYDKCKREN